ncbi:HPr family phosphocarrier protein [Paracoccus sp. (in: a-proteobacteria)]
MRELRRELRIINEKGLHARASARFVETVEQFDARAIVEKDGERVSGDSIMGLLMLVAPRGSAIQVTTSGPDAEALMQALTELVDGYFGEGG